jgi:hypothetical protein
MIMVTNYSTLPYIIFARDIFIHLFHKFFMEKKNNLSFFHHVDVKETFN